MWNDYLLTKCVIQTEAIEHICSYGNQPKFYLSWHNVPQQYVNICENVKAIWLAEHCLTSYLRPQ